MSWCLQSESSSLQSDLRGHARVLFRQGAPAKYVLFELDYQRDTPTGFDWDIPEGYLEMWFVLEGEPCVKTDSETVRLKSNTYRLLGASPLNSPVLHLPGKEKVGMLMIRLELSFLASQLPVPGESVCQYVRSLLTKKDEFVVSPEAWEISIRTRDILLSLPSPPVGAGARAIWFHAKVLELIAAAFFRVPATEMFCARQNRLAQERVEKVKRILQETYDNPPGLPDMAKMVGCSPFYLSRTFSKEMGMTLSQYLRDLRIEKAADLLLTGAYNVTEAAFAVGYQSPSHFSQAFFLKKGMSPAFWPDGKKQSAT